MFKASAPGSLMLLGEYAVLYGQHALVCAIDQRIYVTLTPRDDKKIILESSLGFYETDLSNLQSVAPFQFVLATLSSLKKYLHQGCKIKIESEFSSTIGFASSASVTVATLAALSKWLRLFFSKTELIKLARKIVRDVQGSGSGADVSACVLGGVVLYRQKPFVARKFSSIYPITVVYSGYKTKTPDAIQFVQKKFAAFPDVFSTLIKTINACTLEGVHALEKKNWKKLGEIMTIQQGLMDALGVSTPEIQNILHLLHQQKILGAKISGAGLGDCVIALGKCSLAQQIQVNMSREGVMCEKI